MTGAASEYDVLVLRVTEYREKDRIATVYAREHGRIGLLARGARGSQRRFAGQLDLFVRADAIVSTGRGLPAIGEWRCSALHERLRGDLVKFAIASFMAELVLVTTPEGEPSPAQFDWLVASLDALDASVSAERRDLVLGFQLGWFHLHGVLPALAPESLTEAGLPTLDEHSLATGRALLRPSIVATELDPESARALGTLTRAIRERLVDRPLKSIEFLATLLRGA